VGDLVDLGEAVEPDDMPCCPLCDSAMMDWEPVALFVAHGSVALGHVICIGEERAGLGV